MTFLVAGLSALARSLVSLLWCHPIGPRATAMLALAPHLNGCGLIGGGLTKSSIARFSGLALSLAGGFGQDLQRLLGAGLA